MVLPVNLQIAKTHLLSRKKQSIVAMLGVTFGIAMFILMISFMKGVNKFLQDTMLSSTPDIKIYNDFKTDFSSSVTAEYFKDSNQVILVHHPKPKDVSINIKGAEQIISDLKQNPKVLAVSPMLSTQVFYNYGPVQMNGFLKGVNILDEIRLFDLKSKIIDGRLENLLTTDNGIVMGVGLAKKLNVNIGDMVALASPAGTSLRLRVVGTFQMGMAAIDDVNSYVNISTVQQLLGKDKTYITGINVKLKDLNMAHDEAISMQKKYGYKVEGWEVTNASVEASNVVRDVLTIVVSATMLIVAGFGIYNIMNMLITNKMRDIAILKAQGFAQRDIVQIFLAQSITIGLLGALSGLLFGFLLAYGLSCVPFPSQGFVSLKTFPVIFEVKYYVFGVLFGVITTLVAGLMPSLKASKIDPVAILRG
ncbi:MAG: ABC transporter permease [Flavobacteriales bacterium]